MMVKENTEEGTLVFIRNDVQFETKDRSGKLTENQFLYTPVGCCFKLYTEMSCETIQVSIPENIVKAREEIYFNELGIFPVDDKLKHLIEILYLEVKEGSDQSVIEPLYLYIYAKLKQMISSVSVTYIHDNYHEKLSIEFLATLENYSTNYYYKWFRDRYNCSPKEYIQKIRLYRAKELLLITGYSISDVAIQVGYSQLSSFTRAFKTSENMTPKKYRKLYQ